MVNSAFWVGWSVCGTWPALLGDDERVSSVDFVPPVCRSTIRRSPSPGRYPTEAPAVRATATDCRGLVSNHQNAAVPAL